MAKLGVLRGGGSGAEGEHAGSFTSLLVPTSKTRSANAGHATLAGSSKKAALCQGFTPIDVTYLEVLRPDCVN